MDYEQPPEYEYDYDPVQPEPTFYDDVPHVEEQRPLMGADLIPQEAPEAPDEKDKEAQQYRGTAGDPAFGFLLAMAVSVGLIPLLPTGIDMRYTLSWGTLALVGVLTWLLGNNSRIGREDPENIVWGIGLALLLCVPFLLFFFETFGQASVLLFPEMGAGVILAYLIFVMPLAETLFFRGLIQQHLDFYYVGGLGTLWNIVLFFPVMWGDVLDAPAVALFLAVALLMMNMMYAYARDRNGLAAAWLTQITASLFLLFLPQLL